MMKKLLFFVATVLLCTSIQAQSRIVSSRSVGITSTPEQPSETQWFLRGGLNFMGLAGDDTDDLSKKLGYNVVIGYQKPIGTIGTYWGMEYGLGSRGYKYEDGDYEMNLMTHNLQVSPFTFGWKYGITDNIKIDAHVGAFVSFDYAGKVKYDDESYKMGDWEDELDLDWQRFDAGMNIGVGVWYDRFNLDFTYQRGFMEVAKDWDNYASNFMVRLGIAF